jgi:hypothetical protein
MSKFVVVITVVLMGLVGSGTVLGLDGAGIQEDPWLIQSLEDFNDFANDPNYWDDYTRLETDVNLAGQTYTTAVIAPDFNNVNYDFEGIALTGIFDGNDHKVLNLNIDDGGAGNGYLGLFGSIGKGGQVRNLGVEGVSISGGWSIGGLAGYSDGNVMNCYSTGDVSGDEFDVGGLVGGNIYGSISNCYSTCDASGVWSVGGLLGSNGYDGSLSNCYSSGSVNGVSNVGDLAGFNGGIVSKCYSTGSVIGDNAVGGLVGGNATGSISNCYSTGSVIGSDEDIGGLVGGTYLGSIVSSYSACDVSGNGDAMGGLVGDNDLCIVSNCYSTGDVNGWWAVGGLMGENSGSVSNCYSIGEVSGEYEVGGLVGINICSDACGSITNSYWDIESSGEPNMCSSQNGGATGCDPNYGRTTTEMKQQSTFQDWDFINVWDIGEYQTYPYLRKYSPANLNKDHKVDFLDIRILCEGWLIEE